MNPPGETSLPEKVRVMRFAPSVLLPGHPAAVGANVVPLTVAVNWLRKSERPPDALPAPQMIGSE